MITFYHAPNSRSVRVATLIDEMGIENPIVQAARERAVGAGEAAVARGARRFPGSKRLARGRRRAAGSPRAMSTSMLIC